MIVVVRSYWQDCTSLKIKLVGGFFNFSIEILANKSIDRRAQGRELVTLQLVWHCDKASVAFVASTDPDVHFKCYILKRWY